MIVTIHFIMLENYPGNCPPFPLYIAFNKANPSEHWWRKPNSFYFAVVVYQICNLFNGSRSR